MSQKNFKQEQLPTSGKIVLFKGPGQDFEICEYPLPVLQSGEILIKNRFSSICGSDLHTYCGKRIEPSPTVLGHEIVGEILAIDSDHNGLDLNANQLAVGDLITWTVFSSNPQSANSLLGIPQKGENLFKYGHAMVTPNNAFHGGFAEYCVLKKHTAVLKIPQEMPLDIAATLNCSVSTVAGALRVAGDLFGKSVLITGMGHLGITCAAMCQDAGATWIGTADTDLNRLLLSKSFGSQELYNMNGDLEEMIQSIKSKLPRKGVDFVFDMSGSPDAIEFGMECLAIGGTAIWIGAVFKSRPLKLEPEKVIRNLITIRGLHNYNFVDFSYALDFMTRNWQKYPFGSLVEKEFSLDQTQDAFEFALSSKPLRAGIRHSQD
jgi:putative phosphonate catabolism associated alcohol dehydrogenase